MAEVLEQDAPRVVAPTGPTALLLCDQREGPDFLGARAAMQPLADLCLSPEAQTPFALALVGARGVGKSYALRRLIEAIEAGARAPARLARVVVARIDAAQASGEPAAAIAAAVHAALGAARADGGYAQLAEEAAHGALDLHHAAATAAERHDEIAARLEQERRARDEVEARRARLPEALLFETPGSRFDAFARAARSSVEAKLRRFGFGDGDVDTNYRRLVRDLHGLGTGSRVALFVRALFAYRGQLRLILLAALAFALAILLSRLRGGVAEQLVQSYAQLQPALDWMKAHDEALEYVGEGLIVAGLAALFVNVWRAASFTGLLFRGLRMLRLDLRERRRELDASAARLERRVAALRSEAEAAQTRAETLARRASGGAGPAPRADGPAFLRASEGPESAARGFLAELGRAMAAGTAAAPQRLVIALDQLDALAPGEARRFVETAARLAVPGVAVIAAADWTRLGPDARAFVEAQFEAAFDVEALGEAAGMDGASQLLEGAAASPPPALPGAVSTAGPLEASEMEFLRTAAALIGPRPRALKRFYNAYRLARGSDAPRGALALALAALMAPDPDAAKALRWSLKSNGPFTPPSAPPALRAAFEALSVEGIGREGAREAFEIARRFAPLGG